MSNKSDSKSTTNVLMQRAAPDVIFGPIRNRSISSLSLRDNSPRHYDEHQMSETMQLIETFGFLTPISVDRFGTILVGETLVEAAKRLGLSLIPVTVVNLQLNSPMTRSTYLPRIWLAGHQAASAARTIRSMGFRRLTGRGVR